MRFLFALSLCLVTLFAHGQSKYWIYLDGKNPDGRPAISEKTRQNRLHLGLSPFDETDLPVKEEYIRALKGKSIRVLRHSRWLNAVSSVLTPAQADALRRLDFVTDVVPVDAGFYIAAMPSEDRAMAAPVMEQVQSGAFTKAGLSGNGVTIGVIDAGFYGADSSASLAHIFSNNRILGIRDYVKPDIPAELLYSMAESYSDMHGTEVMAAISGVDRSEQVKYGMAINASFYLARTDYSLREWRGEEDNWIAAMEWMDSLGVRLINTSLGYAKGFTDPRDNYTPSQMDGKTSAISRAAQMAAEQKGMLLVISAGNEGDDKSWRLLSTPADAKGVLTVGATNQRFWNKIGYSSIGPEFLPYLKPNVSCFSLYGTSLSAPVITGFAACLMEADPHLNSRELISVIEKSAHLYPYGNNFVGYGVPQASRALDMVRNVASPDLNRSVTASGRSVQIPVRTTEALLAVYRKKNTKDVISQQVVKVENGMISLRRQTGEKYTTIDLKDRAIEVVWQ